MRCLLVAALFVALPLLSGCLGEGALEKSDVDDARPEAALLVDPLADGPHAVSWADYDTGTVKVGGPDEDHENYEYDSRIRGRMWWPDGEGPWPVLVFLHGQHQTCQFAGRESFLGNPECSEEGGLYSPYPNHLGYSYLAEHAAAHGYVVASVLAYEINNRNGAGDVGMWARGELMLATLDAIRDGSDGMPEEGLARADLSRIGLMGHSRGGEGVVTAVHVNLERAEEDRHAILAVVPLAPTDFNARGVPDVAMLSLVPYCDGDVSTLHGLRTFDHSRHLDDKTVKVQVLVRGTNHNFYNQNWYHETGPLPVWQGNDAGFSLTPACTLQRENGGWRWTPEATQQESLVHVAGFLRWQVGGETGLAPWFTGELPLPVGACPDATSSCDDARVLTTVMPGATRVLVIDNTVPKTHDLNGALDIEGFDRVRVCSGNDCAPSMRSSARSLALAWSGSATITLHFDQADWSAMDVLTLRVATPGWDDPTRAQVDFEVRLADAAGNGGNAWASEHSTALMRTPDPAVATPIFNMGSKMALQAVRIPLSAFDVDTAQIMTVSLHFEDAGEMFLTDVLVQAEPNVS